MKSFVFVLALLLAPAAFAQESTTASEKQVPLNETAVALDSNGSSALEGKLLTSALTGSVDSPVTNTRIVIRNSSNIAYSFVSGVVTFYDNGGVRCGEGVFKANVLAANESFETDTPGIRIRCTPSTWRIVATNVVSKVIVSPLPTTARLIISVDGEQHPLQLDKPLTLNVGDQKRTIIVRQVP